MHPRVIKSTLRYGLLLAFMLASFELAASDELGGEVRLIAERESAGWVGQEVELYLELWSDGLSFGDQLFQLPPVRGGFLLQADSSTVKLNENRDGVQWQGLRYTLLFYPQKAGRLEIPSFDVSFSASAGYGTEPSRFAQRTEPLFIDSRLPPGAQAGSLVTTTSDFSMQSSWAPATPADGPLQLKVGDALTLSLTRTAQDVPGMVFAPLPKFEIDGLAVYPDAPQVKDRINRGQLNGMRSDSVTFICERAGEYEIPEIRFQWWDPDGQVMAQEIIPALEVSVAVNPAYAAGGEQKATGGSAWSLNLKSTGLVVAILLLLAYAAYRLAPVIAEWLRQRRKEYEAGERWAFEQASKACEAGTPAVTYRAVSLWLARFDRREPNKTLLEWSIASGDKDLAREARLLQERVAAGSAGEWSGRKLGQLLVQHRKHPRETGRSVEGLHPLNPPSVRYKSAASG